jgi:hypothetical protein
LIPSDHFSTLYILCILSGCEHLRLSEIVSSATAVTQHPAAQLLVNMHQCSNRAATCITSTTEPYSYKGSAACINSGHLLLGNTNFIDSSANNNSHQQLQLRVKVSICQQVYTSTTEPYSYRSSAACNNSGHLPLSCSSFIDSSANNNSHQQLFPVSDGTAATLIVYATKIERLYFVLIVRHKQLFCATLQLYLELRIIVRVQKGR